MSKSTSSLSLDRMIIRITSGSLSGQHVSFLMITPSLKRMATTMKNDDEYIEKMKKRYAEMYGRMILEAEAFDVERPSQDVADSDEIKRETDESKDYLEGNIGIKDE